MIDWKQKCVLVIPCRNEAEHIRAVVNGARVHLPNAIVVDDGSSDGTSAAAKSCGAEIIRNPVGTGKGAALVEGIRRARHLGFEWFFTMDGDGQHASGDIPTFLAAAENTGASLVIGNRMHGAMGMPAVRRATNRIMSGLLSTLTRHRLPDTQCGMRLIQWKDWFWSDLHCRHFEFESELLVSFLARQLVVEFVPIEVIYTHSHSKIRPGVDTLRWLRWLWGARRKFADARHGSR